MLLCTHVVNIGYLGIELKVLESLVGIQIFLFKLSIQVYATFRLTDDFKLLIVGLANSLLVLHGLNIVALFVLLNIVALFVLLFTVTQILKFNRFVLNVSVA